MEICGRAEAFRTLGTTEEAGLLTARRCMCGEEGQAGGRGMTSGVSGQMGVAPGSLGD